MSNDDIKALDWLAKNPKPISNVESEGIWYSSVEEMFYTDEDLDGIIQEYLNGNTAIRNDTLCLYRAYETGTIDDDMVVDWECPVLLLENTEE